MGVGPSEEQEMLFSAPTAGHEIVLVPLACGEEEGVYCPVESESPPTASDWIRAGCAGPRAAVIWSFHSQLPPGKSGLPLMSLRRGFCPFDQKCGESHFH